MPASLTQKKPKWLDRLDNRFIGSIGLDWMWALLIIGAISSLTLGFEVPISKLSGADQAKLIAGPASVVSALTFASLTVLLAHTQSKLFTKIHKSSEYENLFNALWASMRRFSGLALFAFLAGLFPTLESSLMSFLLGVMLLVSLLAAVRCFRILRLVVGVLIQAVKYRANTDTW